MESLFANSLRCGSIPIDTMLLTTYNVDVCESCKSFGLRLACFCETRLHGGGGGGGEGPANPEHAFLWHLEKGPSHPSKHFITLGIVLSSLTYCCPRMVFLLVTMVLQSPSSLPARRLKLKVSDENRPELRVFNIL